jgi:hypothetical protein
VILPSGGVDIVSAAGGALTAWLRNSSTGTITSVPDVLNTNPATANGGTITGNADFSMSSSTGELLWALVTGQNNGNVAKNQFAIYLWLKRLGAAAAQFPWAIDIGTGGASARTLFAQKSGTSQIFRVYNATATAARNGTLTNVFTTTGTWNLYGWEFDLGSGGTEAQRAVFTINGVVQTVTFSDALGTPGSVPTQFPSVTGNMALSSQGGTNFWDGIIGRNIYVFCAGMTGRTEGLLTQAMRNTLVLHEVPTA